MPENGKSVYDLLEGLDGLGLQTAKDLLRLAGQLGAIGSSGQYFFEKQSADLLDRVTETPVYDESDTLVGNIPSPTLFIDYVILGRDERFDPDHHHYRMDPKLTDEHVERLWTIRKVLMGELSERGKDAAEEFALIGDLLGGEPMTAEALEEMLTEVLG